jgi:hypothetical protein
MYLYTIWSMKGAHFASERVFGFSFVFDGL